MDKVHLNTNLQTSIRNFFQPSQLKKSKTNTDIISDSSSGTRPSALNVVSQNTGTIDLECMSQKCSSSALPRQAAITNLAEAHIQPLRRINALLLPISFPDSFYRNILSSDPPISFSRIIIWSDPEPKVVGGIVCRIDPRFSPKPESERSQDLQGGNDIYILSLALLSPYRGQGLATQALQAVIDKATKHRELNIISLYAHVWTENKDALKWYSAQGFQKEDSIVHGYYRTLKPNTAWIFRRRLTPTDYLTITSSPFEGVFTKVNVTPAEISKKSSQLELKAYTQSRSFQEKGPDQEWNDLPEDVFQSSQTGYYRLQNDSNRSKNKVESSSKSKKKRIYPASTFGN
ncbi:putative N-acetyltransferase san [Erysiphe neolycopersici]|uniref:Putative N-acetyltransferase san n=1 Tax=Erysiphe neolycopersici TaxID=212602 RepID=A0A420HX21_9PEZI|nr:putative N-acetyltransferase san [Erysiphe neolycopersici]